MKKYTMGIFAVLIAIGLYSFESTNNTPLKAVDSLYWFQVATNQGANTSFLNSQVTFISGPSTIIPPGTNCTGTSKKCVVGFSQSQLVAPGYTTLNDNMGLNPQIPQHVGRERSTL